MQEDLKRKPWRSVTVNGFERRQIENATKGSGKCVAAWIRDALLAASIPAKGKSK